MRWGWVVLALAACTSKQDSTCAEQAKRAACVARSRDLAIFSLQPLMTNDFATLRTVLPEWAKSDNLLEAWVGTNAKKNPAMPWLVADEILAAHTTPQQSYSLDEPMRTAAAAAPQIRETSVGGKRGLSVSTQIAFDGRRLGTAVVICRLPDEAAAQ